jgi:methionyl-tRNA formyltransferase
VAGKGEPGRVVALNAMLAGTGEGLLEIRSLQFEGEEEISPSTFVETNKLNEAIFRNS